MPSAADSGHDCDANHDAEPKGDPGEALRRIVRQGRLDGDTFDDAYEAAMNICEESGSTFIHPFDDPYIVAGSGTVGMEIMESLDVPADYVFVTIGGGGLAAGVGTYVKTVSPSTRVIGVEPEGAASMTAALERREVLTLETIDKFVDGAAVKRVGQLPLRDPLAGA